MSTIVVIYVGNDNLLKADHVREEVTGEFMNSATVQVTLFDGNGEEVGGDTWPRTMDYVTDSKGVYRTTLPKTLDLVPNGRYVAAVEVDGGAGLYAKWTIQCVARSRDA